ncbi:Mif2/CENP-C like-domain-containing protein [Mycena filopes]|nr:Mif2/CENP-C like-domain-containing protein [Mycena filopes]
MARTPNKPKAHVPYRGDNFDVGKKTGFKVARAERTADGYEKFDDLLSQANGRTPPRRKKKSMPRVSEGGEDEDDEDEDEDEDGEASMDVDSPVQYSTTPRAAASSRPISRGAAVDFDAVPSPRPRKSVGNAGPSRLATVLTARELLEQDEGDDTGGYYDDDKDDDEELSADSPQGMGGVYDNYDDEVPVKSPKGKGKAASRPEDDSFGDDDQVPVKSPKGKGKAAAPPAPTPKGKGRALPPVDEEDEDQLEDDIARGMDDIDDEEEEEVEEPAPPKKKAKPTPASKPKATVVKSRTQKENRDVPEGVRRSQRKTFSPVAYWRGERLVYAKRDPNHKRLVPYIKEILRVPEEPPAPRRTAGSKRKRSTTVRATPEVIEREVIVEIDASNPEAGWDDETRPTAVVLDYRTAANVTRRVAFTAKMFDPRPAKVTGPDDAWSFEKIFGDGDFMAAGQLVIPAGKRKPGKGTKDNTYIFYVVEGAVNVVVAETNVILATGGMFMVPRGNTYFIENIAEREAKLFFTQARKMREDEEDDGGSGSAPPRGVSVAMGTAVRGGSSMGERSGRSGSAGSTRR